MQDLKSQYLLNLTVLANLSITSKNVGNQPITIFLGVIVFVAPSSHKVVFNLFLDSTTVQQLTCTSTVCTFTVHFHTEEGIG